MGQRLEPKHRSKLPPPDVHLVRPRLLVPVAPSCILEHAQVLLHRVGTHDRVPHGEQVSPGEDRIRDFQA